MSQLSISGINPVPEKPHEEEKKDETFLIKEEAEEAAALAKPETDFEKAQKRYEKRIRLLEKHIDELKMDNRSPAKKYKQVRRMNLVEEGFEGVVTCVKAEIWKRKYSSSGPGKNQSLKLSKSQPSLYQKRDISIQADVGAKGDTVVGLKDFTDTDKMYDFRAKKAVATHIRKNIEWQLKDF